MMNEGNLVYRSHLWGEGDNLISGAGMAKRINKERRSNSYAINICPMSVPKKTGHVGDKGHVLTSQEAVERATGYFNSQCDQEPDFEEKSKCTGGLTVRRAS